MRSRVYVSGFGQVWKDVILLKYSYDPSISALDIDEALDAVCDERERIGLPFSEKPPSFLELVGRGSVYLSSYCKPPNAADDPHIGHPEARRVAKSQGGHAPTSRWLDALFPELASLKQSLIFRRVKRFPLEMNIMAQEHKNQGEGRSCLLRPGCDRRGCAGFIEILLRIHLIAPQVNFNRFALETPLKMTNGEKIITEIPLSDEGRYAAMFYKPPNCLAEPHVAQLRGSLPFEVCQILDREVHPVHRLDGPVSGVMACRLMPTQTRSLTRLKPVNLVRKVYRAISVTDLSESDLAQIIKAKATESFDDRKFIITTYTPPGNMFDRPSPVLSSSVQHEGWKECRTTITLRQVGLRPSGSRPEYSSRSLLSESAHESVCEALARVTSVAEFEIELGTGRRHQIRSVMAFLGFPLFLDEDYTLLAGFDCNSAELLRDADRVHTHAREEWLAELSSIIHYDKALLQSKCSMWDTSHSLLRKMKPQGAEVIGLCAHSLGVEVGHRTWQSVQQWDPWWADFFEFYGRRQC